MHTLINKAAKTQVPVNALIAQRWSPRYYADQAVEPEKLVAILEAARWAASGGNGQPWRFIVATKEDPAAYKRLLACLNEHNQAWAHTAPVLMIAVAQVIRDTGVPSRSALYDTGLAVGTLSVQVTDLGLSLRQMGGFSPDAARETYNIPENFEAFVAIALGYAAALDDVPEDQRERELADRHRRPLADMVFSGTWGETAPWVAEDE
jgi:nitroreductase